MEPSASGERPSLDSAHHDPYNRRSVGPVLTSSHRRSSSTAGQQRALRALLRDSKRLESLPREETKPIDPTNPSTRYVSWNKPNAPDEKFATNAISTGKYDSYFVTFLPIFLFDTFTRVAYIYFLLQASLAWWGEVSPFSPYGPSAALAFVLLVRAVQAIVGDRKRHVEDRQTNNSKATAMERSGDGTWKEVQKAWSDVHVGDVLKVKDGELFAADLLCLHCALDERICYVTTTNLDGETNLKVKRQVLDPSFYDEGWTEEGILDLAVELECEQPDKDLMSFRGRTELQGTNAPPGQQPIQMTQLLLRGCMLKNSGHVLALVVYTGADTRIQMNSAAPPRKMGAFEYFLDTQVAILIVLQLVVCGISAGVSLWWRETKGKDRYYLALDDTAGANSDNDFVYWLLTFITFWILYSYFIPNSLFVTIEIIKFALGFIYIPADREMRDPESGEYAQCRNAALNEDLGKVEYIFSDKTGTLTSNEMRLRAIAIKGQPLGDLQLCLEDHPELHGEEAAKKFSAPMHAAMIAAKSHTERWEAMLRRGGSWPGVTGLPDSVDGDEAHSFGEQSGHFLPYHVMDFWIALALCHGLLVEAGHDDYSTRTYQGPSPDEVAIVDSARQLGFEYVSRSAGETVLSVLGSHVTFETLYVNEFTSERARMSVIVRCPDGTIKLLVKGSDVKMLARMRPGTEEALLERVNGNLQYFSTKGLRTLVVGVREIDPGEFENWEERFRQANNNLTMGEELIDRCLDDIECNLELVGITAVEDKLQKEVPESIATLLAARIKLWMITGDKQETAINIAVSCRLFRSSTDILLCNATSHEAAMELVRKLTTVAEERRRGGQPVELVVDGRTLTNLLGDKEAEEALADLGSKCSAVVVCRASPLQKANIVTMMSEYEMRLVAGKHSTPIGRWLARRRRKLAGKSLAIGDGANDVSMIQSADVGVGIAGKEGRQAANNSDYIISQFRFLVRLLLVHGHTSHFRLGRLIKYFFYKNATFAALLFYFQFFNGFSGQAIIDGISASTYNVLFTSIPCFFFALLDRPTRHFSTLTRYPRTYNLGRGLTTGIFWKTSILLAFIDGAICFFVPYLSASPTGPNSTTDVFSIGKTAYMAMLGVVNIELAIVARYWTWWFGVAALVSWLIGFPFILIYSAVEEAFDTVEMSAYGIEHIFTTAWFWISLATAFMLAFSIRYIERSAKLLFRPDDVMVRAELEEAARREHKGDGLSGPQSSGEHDLVADVSAHGGKADVQLAEVESQPRAAAVPTNGLNGSVDGLRGRPQVLRASSGA